jgi:hypothetical protein
MQLTVTGKQSMSAMPFGDIDESTRGSIPRQILPHRDRGARRAAAEMRRRKPALKC